MEGEEGDRLECLNRVLDIVFFKVSYEENEGMNGCLNDCIVQQQILRKIHCDNMTKYVIISFFFSFENFKSTSLIDFKFLRKRSYCIADKSTTWILGHTTST